LASETSQEEIRANAVGHTIVRREPVGVVAVITPWNFPQALAAMKIGPALAAGCTVVFKASPETALDAYAFADAAVEAGLPEGVINIVPGGRDEGAYLVSHPGVDKVAFTGSTAAGRTIGEACGRLLRPVSLELGGKSAAVVLDDVDLDAMVQNLYTASFASNGQTCFLSSRILAPESRYADVVDAVSGFASRLRVGNPLEPSTEIGPLVSAGHRARVLGYIQHGLNRLKTAEELGATAVVDGSSSDLRNRLRALTGGGATHAIDTTSSETVIKHAVDGLASQGELVLLGIGAAELQIDAMSLIRGGKSIRGSIEGDADPQTFIPKLLAWYHDGRFPVEKVIRMYPFTKVHDAFADLASGDVIKPVLVFD